jgi:hypothetical protein
VLIERAGAAWALGFFAVVLVVLAVYSALDPVIRDEGRAPGRRHEGQGRRQGGRRDVG